MKGFKILFLAVMVVSLLSTGCKKSDTPAAADTNDLESTQGTTIETTQTSTQAVTEATTTDEKAFEKVVLTPMDTNGIVEQYGQLQVIGAQLCDAKGTPVQLKGMSTHGLQYSASLVNKDVITFLKEDWQMQVYRAAMYTEENGYLYSKFPQKKMEEAIAACVELGIYLIIDWHILSDRNPQTNIEESKLFFAEMAQKYGEYPNIIYEICNEPNGKEVTWDEVIKPYAEEVIATIRQYDPDNIIIVGTPTWSQDVDIAAANPLLGDNLMYTLHFYTGSHGIELMDKAQVAIDKGLALFVTEWGTTANTGTGGVFVEETKEWLDFLDKNMISNTNWNISSNVEDSAILKPKAPTNGGWTEANYKESGILVRSYLRGEGIWAK